VKAVLRKFTTVPLVLFTLAAGSLYAQVEPKATDWEEINFEFNSSKLVDGFPSLLRLAELLQKNAGYKVTLEGHADTIGSTGYNQKLGLDRAGAVRDFLVKYGARAGQITTTSQGKGDPKYPGQKPAFSPTDEARWMNRRVAIMVTDDKGQSVGDGSTGEAIRAIPGGLADCCSEVLKRLDKLDEIQRMLKDLADQNAAMKKELDDLKQGQQVIESKLNQTPVAPPAPANPPGGPGGPGGPGIPGAGGNNGAANPPSRPSPFQLLGLNVGADGTGNTTFTGKGRFFAPMSHNTAFQAQGEYLYYKTQREGQFDIGLVQRMKNVQAGLFASFKHVTLVGDQSGGNLGQAALTVDYIFKYGKIGFFGTKGFLDNAVVNRAFATDPVTGATLFNITIEQYLKIVDQAGISGTVGLWKNNYLEGNIGYLHSRLGDRAGGTARFIFPLNDKIAFTLEGGVNETMQVSGNSGRAVVGMQFGNVIRPKEMQAADHPIPVDVPRVRYDVLTRRIRTGNSAPVADAGPDQIGVSAGTITLDGSGSYDPDGDAITYLWTQTAGTPVALSNPTAVKPTFTATSGVNYAFRLTVTDPFGAKGQANTRVETKVNSPVQILFFTATPTSIQSGQSSTLAWNVLNADPNGITITSIGTVQASGSAAVSPTVTTTYTLTAKNSVNTATATATVTVGAGGGGGTKVLFCYATPTNITAGETATINYSAQNADSVTITPQPGKVSNTSGAVTVTPTQTTTYTVTATGAGGTATDSCSVTVSVTAGTLPRIIQFSAIPGQISSGQSSNLLWLVENATSVSISPGIGNVGISGTQTVSPTATTTYVLTATNAVGSVTANAIVNVTVIPGPVITSFTATPPTSPSPGSPVVLSCQATNVASITMAGILFLPGTATYKVYPTVDTTYTCIATGTNGQTVSKTVDVKVTQPTTGGGGTPPTIVIAGGNMLTITSRDFQIDASASFSPAGNNPLTYSWTVANQNPAAILNPTSAVTNVQLNGPNGTYIFNLTVTDSKGNSATATITVLFPITHVQ
jgi:hypothetical protein